MRHFKINFNQHMFVIVSTIVSIIVFLIVVIIMLTHVKSHFKTIVEDFKTQKIKYNKQDFTVATINPVESAQTIDTILTRINKLIDILNANHFSNTRIKHWNSSKIIENLAESGNTSYTINKGQTMALCLRDQTTNKIHDMNTLMFVAIHELAHNVNPSVGHDNQFWNTMAMILKIADQYGLYTIVDYSKNPTQYCGMTIDNTPV